MQTRILLFTLLAGLFVFGITAADAGTINWEVVTDTSVKCHGPGTDKLIGTGDDTTGCSTTTDKNRCNYDTSQDCDTLTGEPATGTFSYSNLDFQLPYSCSLGTGGPCTCGTGESCTSDTDCPTPGCGAANCCAGASVCEECADTSISYFAGDPDVGIVDTCQAVTTNDFEITAFDVDSTESLPSTGGGCIRLGAAGPYVGNGCGHTNMDGQIDVIVHVGNCPSLIKLTVEDITYWGEIVDTGTASSIACKFSETGDTKSYSGASWTALKAAAEAQCGPGAVDLMLLCGTTTLPAGPVPCFEDAIVEFVVVACTDQDAGSCPASDCGP